MKREKPNSASGASISPNTQVKFWTRDSSYVLGVFFLITVLILYFWWPLAAAVFRRMNWDGQWWNHIDWLLVGNFAFMSFAMVVRANLKRDLFIFGVALCGGLVIEAWGTQTNLWEYYTSERPPLWIIPAWPIATLAIDRMTTALDALLHRLTRPERAAPWLKVFYWILFTLFMILMLSFVAPTWHQPFTIFSIILCIILILTPTDYRTAVLVFIAGTGLGYFLELWGTTRHCWTYYTQETPPLFAVLAHGMAAVAFWRAACMLKMIGSWMQNRMNRLPRND